MTPLLASTLSITAACWLVSGLLLLRRGREPGRGGLFTAVCTAVAGGALLAGVLVASRLTIADGVWLFVLAGAVLAPLAVTSYPRLELAHPVDFVAAVVVLGAGVIALLSPPDSTWSEVMVLVTPTVLVVQLWWKLERCSAEQRRPLIWLALGLGLTSVSFFVAGFIVVSEVSGALSLLAPSLVPVAMLIGARSPELVDARGLVVKVVVTLSALLGCVALYVTLVSLIEALGGAPNVGVQALVAAGCALALHPLQVLLHGVVDEMLFGHRPDPLRAATHVAGSSITDPATAIATIRDALVLPFVALRVSGEEMAAVGQPTPHTRQFDLPGMDGQLVVGLRAGDLSLSTGDVAVLQLAAPLVAQTWHAQILNADLQTSRAQTRAALEDERRRVRRDLHDGLGPRLSGIAFAADAAGNLIDQDPEAAEALIGTLREESAAAIADIRRLVYAMRPPALDELGLVGALQQQAEALAEGGRRLAVTVETPAAPAALLALPAAVEVAAYRIAVEALTNVARHTSCESAAVTLRDEDGALMVTVTDSAPGAGAWTPGVGLSSMRERAEEIGGTVTACATRSGGRVEAVLPVTSALLRTSRTRSPSGSDAPTRPEELPS